MLDYSLIIYDRSNLFDSFNKKKASSKAKRKSNACNLNCSSSVDAKRATSSSFQVAGSKNDANRAKLLKETGQLRRR